MDAYVQLALIEKAKRVFATDTTFLSFPLLSPFSFRPEQLAAVNAPGSAADYATAADFARIVNFVPRDIVATVDGETFLWDIYQDILARAEVAAGDALSDVDGAATAMLYIVDSDGTRVESPAYIEYRKYRDAWIVAQENYNAHRLTAESATDEAVRTQWITTDEPALRAAITEAETAWKQDGHKTEIDAALASYERASATDPQSRWHEWQAGFNADIDMVNDASSGGRYAPTGFSPHDLSNDSAWLHFSLSADEIATLVSSAAPELRATLGSSKASDVDHVEFDCRSVAVTRPWFRSAALTARTWRLPSGEMPLSDGGDPPSGRCPAYVCALVFIRKLQLTRRGAAPKPAAPSNLKFTLKTQLLTTRPLTVDRALVARMQVTRDHRVPPPAKPGTPSNQTVAAFHRLSQHNFTTAVSVQPHAVVHPIAVKTATLSAVTAAATAHHNVAKISSGPIRPFRPAPTPHPPAKPVPRPVPKPAPTPISHPPPKPVPPPVPTPVPAPSNDVSVLAFICKRLPKAPDPQPDLDWT